ncbi:MerR family transcriptional regulator [Allosaccharopolyspora coralli]|uniref:MerR family transcriptional regulator n=1 Tax=Allosaccharopolyspora coralli TaxID=2665642 RepID=A0A5Q3QNU4_9PSEU|nr:MerR family transcriptional regulator [Allosaccharopolyspora coralli]
MQSQDDSAATGAPLGKADEQGSEAVDYPQADEPKLTVAAVARRLGVAPATLRTWDRRYGLGPSDHTTGRHRRYGSEDIARLEHMQRALLRGASPAEAARYARSTTAPPASSAPEPAVPAGGDAEPVLQSGVLSGSDRPIEVAGSRGGRGLRLAGAGPRARGLGSAVLGLDSWSAQHLMIESIEAEGVATTWLEVVQPVLRAVVERRQRTGSGAEVVQLLVDSVSTALRAVLASAPAPSNSRPVLLASVPGEVQELELIALAAALATQGVGHRLFGPALQPEGLDAAVRRCVPVAVVVWSEQASYASPQLVAGVHSTRRRVRAFAAGGGWAAESLPAQVELLGPLDRAVERLSTVALGEQRPS